MKFQGHKKINVLALVVENTDQNEIKISRPRKNQCLIKEIICYLRHTYACKTKQDKHIGIDVP